MAIGKVSLVGAGPGDPDLITRRGLRAIQQADVLVYDRLAAPAIIAEARAGCELVYVGKEGNGHHAMSQQQINQVLVEQAQAGRKVCRLKGGDPFVFGRGGEEALVLAAAGVPYEVVPGVTAGVGASAYAGIPVTQRGVSTAAIFVTGHDAAEPDPDAAPDWEALGALQATLVIYMGMSNLASTAARLMAGGRSPETPAAVIRWGTRAEQQVVTATLASIASAAKGVKPPALVVVGEVVALREQLAWFEEHPLAGRRVLIAGEGNQADSTADDLAEAVRQSGGEVWQVTASDLSAKAHLATLLQAELRSTALRHIVLLDPAAAAPLVACFGGPAALEPFTLICTTGRAARAARQAGMQPLITNVADPAAIVSNLLSTLVAPTASASF